MNLVRMSHPSVMVMDAVTTVILSRLTVTCIKVLVCRNGLKPIQLSGNSIFKDKQVLPFIKTVIKCSNYDRGCDNMAGTAQHCDPKRIHRIYGIPGPGVLSIPLAEPVLGAETRVILDSGVVAKTYRGNIPRWAMRMSFADEKGLLTGGFRKCVNETDGNGWMTRLVTPTQTEIERFKIDVNEAARTDPELARFVQANPALQLS